jgi:hypothetical protein
LWIVPERVAYEEIYEHVTAGFVVEAPRVLTSEEFVEGL